MAGINRIGSPMELCDEGLHEAPGVVEKRKRTLEIRQQSKSPFLIGTIEDVNRKIGKLEQRLQHYTQLVAESHVSDHTDDFRPSSSRDHMSFQDREQDDKDVCKFAGIYTLKSTLLPHLSSRIKNISKISKHSQKDVDALGKDDKDSCKARFLEMHQFPGFDATELTPLPGYEAIEILQVVMDASTNLDKKPFYRKEFQHLFFSPMSQAVLQDIFWYIFLNNFQPSPTFQHKLFNRISHNYVKLLFYAKDPLFRDIFLKDYPMLVSQAVYSAFCHCFPDSYRQFGEQFKNELIYLIYGWMAGFRPSPRYWSTWRMSKLEPPNMRNKDDSANKNKKKLPTMTFNFDYLDTLVPSHPSQYPSSMSLNQSGSKTSIGTNLATRRNSRWSRKMSRINPDATERSTSPSGEKSPPMSHEMHMHIIETVAKAQRVSSLDSHQSSTHQEAWAEKVGMDSQRSSIEGLKYPGGKEGDKDGYMEALSPIREMTSEDDMDQEKKLSLYSMSLVRDSIAKDSDDIEMKSAASLLEKSQRKRSKSHPACRGAEFLRAAFNINGRSPLVAHFLRMRKMTTDLNNVVRIQHTEVSSLPPLNSPTYQDVIKESSRTVRTIEKRFQEMYIRNQKESTAYLSVQHEILKDHRRRESALLANRSEVKRLSDLIVLEQRKGLDSISAGASQAVEAALMAQELLPQSSLREPAIPVCVVPSHHLETI